jgi:DNA-binding transcriptional LysR family regulator
MIASPNELLYFIELAKVLNFSRASERIGISQPSLSAAIKRLEYSLGTELFIRDKHKVNLTQAGKNLVFHAKQLLQLWDTTKANCLASQHEVQGRITLGCHPTIALTFLPKFFPELISNYPLLEIQLKHDLSRKIMEGVINLTIDVGIVVNPIKHPDLIITRLLEDEITGWKLSSTKMADDKTIICDPDLIQTQWILKRMQKKGIKYKRMITTNNLEVIGSLTATGAGTGIMPANAINTMSRSKLVKEPGIPIYRDEICLVHRHENRGIKAVQVLTTAIKESIKEM